VKDTKKGTTLKRERRKSMLTTVKQLRNE